MPYTVKLKNQTGAEIPYSFIEQLAVPLASGAGNAVFVARYEVTKTLSTNITYEGGDFAAHGIDYMCRISTGSTGKNVPASILVTVGGNEINVGTGYTYTKLSDTEAFVKINGESITGNVTIVAVAVAPSE